MEKRHSFILFLSIILIVSLSFVASSEVILKLSSNTNAHAGRYDSGYSNLISNPFEYISTSNDYLCNGENTVLRLSGSTNAHAEVPSGQNPNYQPVCYQNFVCVSRTNSCQPGERLIVRLSNITNSHLELPSLNPSLNNYGNLICCSQAEIDQGERAYNGYWGILGNNNPPSPIQKENFVLGSTANLYFIPLNEISKFQQGDIINYSLNIITNTGQRQSGIFNGSIIVSSQQVTRGWANDSIPVLDSSRTDAIGYKYWFNYTIKRNSNLIYNNHSLNNLTIISNVINNNLCGNGLIDAGETCDTNGNGPDIFQDGASCGSLGEGEIFCNSDCKTINYNLCTNGPGISTCDDINNLDNDNLEDLEQLCESYDFNFGTDTRSDGDCKYLIEDTCAWQNDKCVLKLTETLLEGDENQCNPSRSCIYKDTISGDCDAGDDFFSVSYTVQAGSDSSCRDYNKQVSCANAVKLPFFDKTSFILSLIIMMGIYFIFENKNFKIKR